MKMIALNTPNEHVRLIEPDLERDAQLGVVWLAGEAGRKTLKLMGVADENNNETSLEAERERVTDFINTTDQLNWMISYDGQVVGSVWVDLKEKESVHAPSVHIMIGDPDMRGKGVGAASISAVVSHLHQKGETVIFSRHLLENSGATKLLTDLGFVDDGDAYHDDNGLEWQNVVLNSL